MKMDGGLCVVTGANSGLGRRTVLELARRGSGVVMICRDRERGEAARREISGKLSGSDLRLRLADLASLSEVRRLGESLSSELDRVDVLVNNAGIYRANLERSEEGFEKTMAVNHLAHFLLTQLLLEPLLASRGRVINVASEAHRAARLRRAPLAAILRGEGEYRGFRAYGDSKAANILFTGELERRYGEAGLGTAAVHPGMVATRIWNQNRDIGSLLARLIKPLMHSPRKGAEPIVRLAADVEVDALRGGYYDREQESEPAPDARDSTLARTLWELSEQATGLDAR